MKEVFHVQFRKVEKREQLKPKPGLIFLIGMQHEIECLSVRSIAFS